MQSSLYYLTIFRNLTRISWLFGLILVLSSCGEESTSNVKKPEDEIRPVRLIEVGGNNNNKFLNYPAVIKSQQLTTLSFEVAGVVNEVLVTEAQKVNQGDILAKLDKRDLNAKLSSARAEYDIANSDYQRAVRLLKGDAISRSELEKRKSKRDVNQAKLETAEKALGDSVLIAPYAGNIASLMIQKQQAIQAGEDAISILGLGNLEATINLPSRIIAMARKRKDPQEYSYITLDVAPDRQIPARYKETTLEADAASQTYAVTFAFDAPEGINILPGMNATVWFIDPSQSGVGSDGLSIPLSAISIDGEQKYVWAVNTESMTVSKKNITIEDGVGEYLNISSGLEAGETIVATGTSSLSEGMKVRPWTN